VRNFLASTSLAVLQKTASFSGIPSRKLAERPETLFNARSNSEWFGGEFRERSTMRRPGSPASLLFRLIIPATAAFVITILALVAVVFGDERAPLARVINRYGNLALIIEFLLIIVLTLASMTVDRLTTLRQLRTDIARNDASPGDNASNSNSNSNANSASTSTQPQGPHHV
jgi:hypothetical protein